MIFGPVSGAVAGVLVAITFGSLDRMTEGTAATLPDETSTCARSNESIAIIFGCIA
jgi:hypothetical protein